MPSPEEFELALTEIREYVEAVGDKVVDERVEGIITTEFFDEEKTFIGHRCESGDGPTYIVAGHPDHRFFLIGYFLSIRQNLANEISEEAARKVLESREVDGEDAPKLQAIDVLLSEMSEQNMETLTSYLYLMLSSSTVGVNLYFTDDGIIDFYNVGRQIHPYEEKFGLQDFYDALTAVENIGEMGSRLVGRTIWLDTSGNSPEEYSIHLNFDW